MKNSDLKRITLFCIVIIFAGALTVLAQPAHKAMERIGQLKKSKLLDILDLNEEASNKFLSKFTTYEKKLHEQKKQIDETSADLEDGLRKGISKDDLNKKSQKLLEAQMKLQDMNIEKLKAMKDVLNETEYAKYLVFEDRFPKELQRMLFKRQKDKGPEDRMGKGKGKGRMPPPPDPGE